ncbi:meiotic cell cortex C-terminal pleckstrin homology-domain-containing protein [Spinellus fusiger]|nr:meiotic cell cortex C-terminal pleckstrin homology-domain-containing protein [Spinellus fusiger]
MLSSRLSVSSRSTQNHAQIPFKPSQLNDYRDSVAHSPEISYSTSSFSLSQSVHKAVLLSDDTKNMASHSCSSSVYSFISVERASSTLLSGSSSKPGLCGKKRLQRPTLYGKKIDIDSAKTMLRSGAGKEFLSAVQSMHCLLKESQENIHLLETDNTNNQQKAEFLSKQLRQKCVVEEQLKEEIWNLELSKQELTQQIQSLTQSLTRSRMDQARMERQESLITQELELLKTTHENWSESMEKAQCNYEHELVSLRQTLENVRQERDTLSLEINQYTTPTTSFSSMSLSSTFPSKSNYLLEEGSQEKSSRTLYSNQTQLKTTANILHEVEKLWTSLSHSHTVIQTLQQKLTKERLEKSEVDALLRESQETIEALSKQPRVTQLETWVDSCNNSVIEEPLNDTYTKPYMNDPPTFMTPMHPLLIRSRSLGDELFIADSMQNKNKLHNNNEREIISASIDNTLREDTLIDKGLHTQNRERPKSWTHCYLTSISSPPLFVKPWCGGERPRLEECGSVIIESGVYTYETGQLSTLNEKRRSRHYYSKTNLLHKPSVEDVKKSTIHNTPIITRTMMGDWMFKYTRKLVGQGISEKKHRRFFWLHPYNMLLYWSTQEPGKQIGVSDAKSVLIESFRTDSISKSQKKEPPSITIVTSTRTLKIQCLNHETHAVWIKSLYCLLDLSRKNV